MANFYMRDGKIAPSKGGGTLVVAMVLAGMVATSTAGFGSAGTERAIDAAHGGQYEQVWRQLNLQSRSHVTHAASCAITGELRGACRDVEQSVLMLNDMSGNELSVSISWVRMTEDDTAEQLRHKVGDAAQRRGELVVIAEAEPVDGQPCSRLMRNVVAVAKEFPSPD